MQYEDIPDYYNHCKHQGYPIDNCRIKRREDELKEEIRLKQQKNRKVLQKEKIFKVKNNSKLSKST